MKPFFSSNRPCSAARRGATVLLALFLLVVMLGAMAFSIDCGHILLVRTQLQVAADSAAMAAAQVMGSTQDSSADKAKEYAAKHVAAGKPVTLLDSDIEYGIWDATTREFTPTPQYGNAIRVTARRDAQHGGQSPSFFGRIFGRKGTDVQAQAIAMGNPRDICFVVDLSGSMNDDTSPGWTGNGQPSGKYASIIRDMMQTVFDDFDYGKYPGTTQNIGAPLGVSSLSSLANKSGPLSKNGIPSKYRITNSDNTTAKREAKAFRWVMDVQIPAIMPNAKPTPNSDNSASFNYWKKYIDDVDNKNSTIGYRTYVQHMMYHGRDLEPGDRLTPLSIDSPDCPLHYEATAGGTFQFPPSEQPTHAARRSVIAALEEVRARNEAIPDENQRDWVSIVTFDKSTNPANPSPLVSVTGDYHAAMEAASKMQAVGDNSASTATETGLIAGYNHIKPQSQGGWGRENTQKVLVLLTDGMPNLKTSSNSAISNYRYHNSNSDFYGGSNYNQDAALMQAHSIESANWKLYSVPLGLGADNNFMDRMARMAGTANNKGEGMRTSGDPSAYETELSAIFKKIVDNPKVRMVQ